MGKDGRVIAWVQGEGWVRVSMERGLRMGSVSER